jgi:hypothetical protein
MLETLFMAIYNEEIMIDNNGDNLTKRQEIIRVPSIRYPSIYHDPSKMGALLPDQTLLTRLNAISLTSELPVQMTMRIGPFPNVDRLTSESRFMVLTRLCKSVSYLCLFNHIYGLGKCKSCRFTTGNCMPCIVSRCNCVES